MFFLGQNLTQAVSYHGQVSEGLAGAAAAARDHRPPGRRAARRPTARGSSSRRSPSPTGTRASSTGTSTSTIAGGEKVGLVGHSGAGKSTLVSLLLRQFELAGRAASASTASRSRTSRSSPCGARWRSCRRATSLFHRSILDNIRYGRLAASDEEVVEAARLAEADGFIRAAAPGLRDPGRRARRQAVGRPAAAHRDRARPAAQRADPAARRGHERPRQRERGGDPARPRRPDARQDRDRDRPPALDPAGHGPHRRPRAGAHRRGRQRTRTSCGGAASTRASGTARCRGSFPTRARTIHEAGLTFLMNSPKSVSGSFPRALARLQNDPGPMQQNRLDKNRLLWYHRVHQRQTGAQALRGRGSGHGTTVPDSPRRRCPGGSALETA